MNDSQQRLVRSTSVPTRSLTILSFTLWLLWVVAGQGFSLVVASGAQVSIAVVSLVAEHRRQVYRLSSCSTLVSLLHDVWELPGPDIKPVSSALGGKSTVPPEMSQPLTSAHQITYPSTSSSIKWYGGGSSVQIYCVNSL